MRLNKPIKVKILEELQKLVESTLHYNSITNPKVVKEWINFLI